MFNLAIILQNLNSSQLVKKYRLRAKVGHLAQWIEFHSLRPLNAQMPLEIEQKSKEQKSEKGGLLADSKEFQESNSKIDL